MNALPFKILAVDNRQLLLWSLKRAFKGRALNLDTASTTEQALVEIDLNSYDLFILDFDLNDRKQQELLAKIDATCPFVPIIFMTACDTHSSDFDRTIKDLRKQGEWHLLEKPFNLDRLFSFIEAIFLDKDHILHGLKYLEHNYDSEKRQQIRQPHVQPVTFTYKYVADGKEIIAKETGIVTDLNDYGVGLITHTMLRHEQVISFGETLDKQFGIVSWCNMIEPETCRAGIRLC